MRHAGELRAAGRIRRAVEEKALERFLECGDPHYGFARVYCDACRHDWLLAYSCKTRYFCPSCHQKRVLLYGEWVEESVLAPVSHRQYVFTIRRLLRPIFARRRAWLGELCRIAARLLVDACAEGRHPAQLGRRFSAKCTRPICLNVRSWPKAAIRRIAANAISSSESS